MKKKLTVTIGIPAFNEEVNIAKLLKLILQQNRDNFILQKIIVVSDGSTDKTIHEVEKVSSKFIRLIDNKKRKGLNPTQNTILKESDSKILVIINADTLPVGKLFLKNLIEPFYNDSNIGIVGARIESVIPNSFTGRVLANSAELKELIVHKINNKNNVYLCHGQARAFSKPFYKNIKWPYNCPEDSYSYFMCLKKGFKFVYVKKAAVYFLPSSNIKDHLKQSKRFTSGILELEKLFGSKNIKESYKIPPMLGMSYLLIYVIKKPILTIGYLLILFIFSFIKYKSIDHSKFEVSQSSKILSKSFPKEIVT